MLLLILILEESFVSVALFYVFSLGLRAFAFPTTKLRDKELASLRSLARRRTLLGFFHLYVTRF